MNSGSGMSQAALSVHAVRADGQFLRFNALLTKASRAAQPNLTLFIGNWDAVGALLSPTKEVAYGCVNLAMHYLTLVVVLWIQNWPRGSGPSSSGGAKSTMPTWMCGWGYK